MMSSDLVLSESVVFWLIHVVLFRLSSLNHCSLVREQKHNAWLEFRELHEKHNTHIAN